MSGGIRVLAVDDERPALEDLAAVLRGHPAVAEVVTASSGSEALQILVDQGFDAVFLDVRMPGLDGVELARVLRRFAAPPALVFVSAYESAAVQAFELRAVDYLLKPVSRQRIDDAIERIQLDMTGRSGAAPAERRAALEVVPVAMARGGGTRLLQRSSILYLEAYGDYVRVCSTEGRFLLRGRLAELGQRWSQHGFVQVHRRFVVNLGCAVEMRPLPNGTAVVALSDGSEVPIARRQVAEVRRRLGA